jgi:surface antigen
VRKFPMIAIAFLFTLGAMGAISQARTEDDTIKKVMKAAMKGGLCKKVADGKATPEQKKELLELFDSLAKATPPKGEEASWGTKTKALVDAAHGAVDGKTTASAQLKTAANCKACHDVHKGK